MALSNDMTNLLNKISRRLGLIPLEPHLPDYCNKESWAKIIMEDTIVTFSRFFPNQFKMIINDSTCDKKKDDQGTTWYYIKDEILQGAKLLGVRDIDWMDGSSNNSSLGATNMTSYYYPSMGCPAATFESILSLQMAADFNSLFNRGIVVDFQYPNRFCLKGLGNVDYDLNSFTLILLVEHNNLSTISPTMMNVFEDLAMADVANYLYQNLKYYDNLETAFINIDMKLNELNDVGNKRDSIVDRLENSYVSASNNAIPYIMTV